MRGVRGKRGVWPPLGLCALFKGAVGRVHLPDPVRGTQGQNTPKNGGKICHSFGLQIAQSQRGWAENGPTYFEAG